ncbi:MAG: preprotein translocase subunit SecG [Turicibacter sp.]|nr:preprotein translocase subunit SecG [Turicibacter sp.]
MFQFGIVEILLLIVAIVIIVLVSLQNSKDSLGDALTGGNSELFKNQKERGAEAYIVRATYVCTAIFLILALIIFMR